MTPPAQCRKCGATIAPDSLSGQCPACLLHVAELFKADAETTPEHLLQPRDRRVGDYLLGPQLAAGGMGVVYEAHQISLNRKVALKFIRDSQIASPIILARFLIEAEAAARLHHPNIVRIHEIGQFGRQPYFSMDLIEGESLRTKIAKGDFAISKEEGSKSNCRTMQVAIARFMAKIAHAIHHAHHRGVLHRDLKPANVVVDHEGEPHLTDFGLAKILRTASEQGTASKSGLTAPGDIAGTPSYMAPEQIGSAPATASSDVYGLGAILYELLTRRPPFQGNTPLETLRHVQDQSPARPRSVNRLVEKDLETICMKCLEKDPRHRYGSALALAEDLEQWIERKPIKAHPAGPVRQTTQWMQRNRVGTALICVLFLALASSLVVLNVVQNQKKTIEEGEGELFSQITRRLSDIWADPKSTEVTIESRNLAILAGRPPAYNNQARTVTLGISIYWDAISFASWRAVLMGELEQKMSEVLGEPVSLDLKLFKDTGMDSELLVKGWADFMSVEPGSYITAKARGSAVRPIAVEKSQQIGVIVAHRNSGASEVRHLAGKSIAFAAANDPLTTHAKAVLVDAGLFQQSFSAWTNFNPFPVSSGEFDPVRRSPRVTRRDTLAAVFKERFDAGITTLRRYELDKHRGLVKLAEFSRTPNVFVAREGIDSRLVEAFRAGLLYAAQKLGDKAINTRESFDWDEPFPGAAPIDDSGLNPFREALAKAVRFDRTNEPTATSPH